LKYYSVYKGKSGSPKIFTSWDECKKEVAGVSGAIYKSFKTEREAIEFLKVNSENSSSNSETNIEDGIIVYVDGSFIEAKENYSYGLVVVNGDEVLYKENGIGDNKEAISHRNVAGEVLGATRAVIYAEQNNIKEITIAYDYQGIESWALGFWKRNTNLTETYHQFMKEKMKDIKIRFKKIKGHSGDKYNDLADELAKEALEKLIP